MRKKSKKLLKENYLKRIGYEESLKINTSCHHREDIMDKKIKFGCRNCSKEITKFFSLGKIPLGNGFLKKEEIPFERKYDLSVGFCPNCYLTQLIKTIPPEKLYRKSYYFHSTFESIIKEHKERAFYLTKRLNISPKSLVLDIGSHDGSQLRFFKKPGMKILGVDPARNMAEAANKKDIPTITEFFSYKLAKKIKKERGFEADLILCMDLLNHTIGIKDFLKGVKLLLKPRGTAFFKFFMQGEFDIINHEHVFYFSFLSLKKVLRNVNLEMYDADIQNGVLSIFISHPGIFPISEKVKNFIQQEINKGFNKLETYQKFAKNVIKSKKELVDLLKNLKNQGKRIAGYSASEKGNILLNYCGIEKNYLDFIVDKSELKQGLYTPGTHLLIYPPEKIYQERPNYLLILCWNIAKEVIKQLQAYHKAGGKFIIPIPRIKIV